MRTGRTGRTGRGGGDARRRGAEAKGVRRESGARGEGELLIHTLQSFLGEGLGRKNGAWMRLAWLFQARRENGIRHTHRLWH